jgi:hypothetical protein
MKKTKSKVPVRALVKYLSANNSLIKVSKAIKRKKKGKKQQATSLKVPRLASLIANPCHGPLQRVVGLGQIEERIRSTFTGVNTSGDTCGYVVWFPSYHNPGGTTTGNSANLYQWEHSSSSQVPTNTGANPMGVIAINTTGLSRADPASAILGASSAFTRARTLSACLQVEYIGALQSIAGQVAVIKNLPLRAFYGITASTTTFLPPTVDALFAYAATRERIQATGHEVIWRPSNESAVMRSNGNELHDTQVAAAVLTLRSDAPYANGITGSIPSAVVAVDPDEIYGIAIAWKGVANTTSSLAINAIKVVDLELAPSGGAIEPEYTAETQSVPYFTQATRWLDTKFPGWQEKAMNTGAKVAGDYAAAVGPKMLRYVTPGIRGNYLSLTNGP